MAVSPVCVPGLHLPLHTFPLRLLPLDLHPLFQLFPLEGRSDCYGSPYKYSLKLIIAWYYTYYPGRTGPSPQLSGNFYRPCYGKRVPLPWTKGSFCSAMHFPEVQDFLFLIFYWRNRQISLLRFFVIYGQNN